MAFDSNLSNQKAALESAIDKVLSAQEYGINSRRTRYASLKDLFAVYQDVTWSNARASDGMFTVSEVASPTL